jgi:putative aminopeptidase FrvX
VAARRSELQACLIAASTIQEENGLYGATMTAYRVKPDVAIVVDVTHATDTPQASKAKHGDVRLGGGPTISIGSANHPVVNERLRRVAEQAGIPLQVEINPRRTGTDADAIFVTRGGIPTTSVGLPNRYMHSPVEIIELSDLDQIADLLAAFALDVKPGDTFGVEI